MLYQQEMNLTKEDIYDSIIDVKAGVRKIFAENIDDVNIKVEKTGKAKKQINSDGLYQLNVQISGTAKVNGEKEKFEDEDDWIRGCIESQINDCKRNYYADDDYQDTKFSETVTEADVCGSWTTGLFTVKTMDTNKKYFGADDLYKGSDELLVDVDKLYFVNTYDTMEYYYATFKEGKDGSIELDELKQYVNGKWNDVK